MIPSLYITPHGVWSITDLNIQNDIELLCAGQTGRKRLTPGTAKVIRSEGALYFASDFSMTSSFEREEHPTEIANT